MPLVVVIVVVRGPEMKFSSPTDFLLEFINEVIPLEKLTLFYMTRRRKTRFSDIAREIVELNFISKTYLPV